MDGWNLFSLGLIIPRPYTKKGNFPDQEGKGKGDTDPPDLKAKNRLLCLRIGLKFFVLE